nr:leucine-rich repeat extensin-like protein 1 [Aegilops tauschii subsp. strangulata]
MTAALQDLTQAVAGIRTFLASPCGPQPPGPFATPPPPWQPPPSATPSPPQRSCCLWQPPPAAHIGASTMQQQPSVAPTVALPHQQLQPPPTTTSTQGAPTTAQGVPIHQVRFPPSPSPLPAWHARSLEPVYTTASGQPHVLPLPVPPSSIQFGGPSGSADPYAGVDGPLFQGGPLMPTYSAPSSSLLRTDEVYPSVVHGQTPQRFSKLEFATYDGTVDPLNWLNQRNQFFRGQRTLESDRTWIASYHLRGAAQTWYYALKQDEGGMSPWERFRELCLLRFGPPIRGSRLAELGRLPFTSTVHDLPTASRPWLATRAA